MHQQERLGSTVGGHGRPTSGHGRPMTMAANHTAWTFLWVFHAVLTTQAQVTTCTAENETGAVDVVGRRFRMPRLPIYAMLSSIG